MAAELERLIHKYQQSGLWEAARHLAALKIRLKAQGMLPPSLDALETVASHTQTLSPSEVAIVERLDVWGSTLHLTPVDGHRYDLEGTYELDNLGLSARHRNALVRAGVTTLAEIQFLITHDLLHDVRSLGQGGIDQLETWRRSTADPSSMP